MLFLFQRIYVKYILEYNLKNGSIKTIIPSTNHITGLRTPPTKCKSDFIVIMIGRYWTAGYFSKIINQ